LVSEKRTILSLPFKYSFCLVWYYSLLCLPSIYLE
jgi:hypothetical protein